MIVQSQTALPAANADVLSAIRSASIRTGSDFEYLLSTAMRESHLQPEAKSRTSSATGLFQFIEQTWLGLVKRYGARYGLDDYAEAIERNRDGHYLVRSKETKAAILALRKNAEVSALMAGESAKEAERSLECLLGREVCAGELYAAHFLGQGGARRLIVLNQEAPNSRADRAFTQASKANRAVFYHADGTPKTIGEVYAWAVDSAKPTQPTKPAPPETVLVADAVPYMEKPALPAATHAKSSTLMTLADSDEVRKPTKPESDIAAFDAEEAYAENYFSQPFLGADVRNLFRAKGNSAWSNVLPNVFTAKASLPPAPLVLSPGVVEILASLAPSQSDNEES